MNERRRASWMRHRPFRLWSGGIWGFLLLGLSVIILTVFFVAPIFDHGPEQPIPFSHRIHVSTKQLNCFFCHNSAAVSSNAGMPSVEKCLLCHSVIATKWQPIAKITKYYQQEKSIPWVRVNRVPDHVRFNHQAHLAKRIDCSKCHGNVKQMDRISEAHRFNMDFCVKCHWKNNAPSTCYTCHY